jgi:hypothetical protein
VLRRALVSITAAAIGVFALPDPANAVDAPSPARPDVCASDRGYIYDNVSNKGLVLDGFGTARIFQNGTGSNATQSLAQSSTGTSQWSVNGSVSGTSGFNFAVIKGSVTATAGGSYTSTHAETSTVTATITIPGHQYGILQGGVFRRVTTGHYYYDNGNCTYTAGSTITTKIPVAADGQAATTNTTGNVPWDQG